jgi:mycofactocin precursor
VRTRDPRYARAMEHDAQNPDTTHHTTHHTANDTTHGTAAGVTVEEELLVEEISIDGMCGVY